MTRYFFCILFSLLLVSTQAQLLDGYQGPFTEADTLRGALRPERTCFDVNAYDLFLDINFENRSIAGYNDISFTTKTDFETLQLDLFRNMEIDSILFKNKVLKFTRKHNAVFVHFDKKIAKGSQEKIRVYYHGKPIIAKNAPWDGGFSWKKDDTGKNWLGVSCEGIGASLWWPNKDHLSDEPDTMTLSCRIPKDLKFVGNGRLINNTVKDNKRLMTWQTSYPINNYNVTLNIGDYINFKDEYTSPHTKEKLVLDYWVLPYHLEKAKKHFEQVKPMLACFEGYFGKFPFWKDNYKLVETPYLGMEHQTAIAYGNKYKKGYNGIDYSGIGLDFDYIIIHETGHEYWGNLISAADIADLWIHEGFCTYSEALYVECLYDYKTALDYINAKKSHIGNEQAILGIKDVNHEGNGDMYSKGSLFLNTLRHIINDDALWFDMLKDMTTQEFAYQTTDTDAIIDYFNKKSSMRLDAVFEQYLAHPSIPKLYYSVEKLSKNKYQLNYKWLVDVSNFKMPVVLKLGKRDIRLLGSTKLKSYIFTKKRKEKIQFDQEKFYIETKKASF